MTGSRTNFRPLLLGHRGARGLRFIPENTLASFDQALADGCDGFEFDVRLTADGKPVICHDPRVGGVEIAQASAEQLTGLPHLQDVLQRYQDRAFLDIELKVSGLEQITLDLLRQYPPSRGFVVSSFLPQVIHAAHAADSGIPLGLIAETAAQLRCWSELPIGYLISHYKLVDADLIRALRAGGKKLLVWTVNDPAMMRRLAKSGVDGIISDKTSLLSGTINR